MRGASGCSRCSSRSRGWSRFGRRRRTAIDRQPNGTGTAIRRRPIADDAAAGEHASTAAASKSHDVGVLYVHGIGDQGRGATLREFGRPLIESVGDWLGQVTVEPTRDLGPDVPVHASVTVATEARTLRVLTAESWWATAFQPPGYLALMRWLLSAVPFVVQRAADGGLRRTNLRMDGRMGAGGSSAPARAGHALVLVSLSTWRLAQNAAAVALTIIVMAGLVAVASLAVTRRARELVLGRRRRRSAGNVITRYIGDSYALLAPGGAAESMVRCVERDLRWLGRSDPGAPVAIVAHSQGAELVRQVLLRRPPGNPVDSVITFGAGIEKLHAVGRMRERSRLAWAAFALRIASVGGVVVAGAALLGTLRPWLAAIGLAVAFGALAAARAVLREVVGKTYGVAQLKVGSGHVGRWLDLYASHDPVSEGELPISDFGESCEIVNRRSPLRDHTAYWHNVEGFRAAVALELGRVAGWPATPKLADDVATAATDRARRVRWLVVAHAAIALVAFVVVAVFGRELGELLAGAAGVVDGRAEAALLVGWRPQATACLLLAVVAGGLAVLASKAWDAWSRRQTLELLAARQVERSRRDLLSAGVAVAE